MLPSHEKTASLTQAGLNLIQQALTIYGSNLKLLVCNGRFKEMFNLPIHLTIQGADFAETIRYLTLRGEYGEIGDAEAFVKEKVDQALDFEPHYVERQRANGTYISVEGSPLTQGGWVTVYTDITAIKRQESLLRSHSAQLSDQLLNHSEELARANRQLASTVSALGETQRQLIESESLSRTTAQMMPAHIAHVDLNERYTYSNGKLGIILGDDKTNIEGMTASQALGAEVYDEIKPYIDMALKDKPSVFEFSHSENSRRIRCAFTPGYDAAGNINGVYFLTMDVTEEAQSRAALMQTHKRELAAQLTSGLAHDFANLLTIILGLQGRLEKLENLPENAREMITTTRAAALRGGALLDRLSNVSGPREINPKSVDMANLFSDIQALAKPSLPDDIDLSFHCGNCDRPVMVDGGYLQDSLLNLILNARDAIGNVGGSIKVTATALKNTWLEICATDSGPGFSDDALIHALDPFYTTKRNDEGSGLGLSMVYDFTQLSGGHVRISNVKGGAKVTLRLPLKFGTLVSRPKLVLLVEDSPEIRTNVREMLREMGHSVLEAASMDEAAELANIPGVDTVLSDISLSDKNTGLDLLRTLRGHRANAQLFMMTSLPLTNALRQTATKEFPLIGKPFSQVELRHFLEGPSSK